MFILKKISIFVGRKDINFLNVIEMKKIYYLFVALVACFMFVACDTTQGGTSSISDKDKENATRLVELYEASYSHLFAEGVTNDYWMSFFTTELDEEEGYPKGTSEFVSLEFFPMTIENGVPVGDFAFAEDPQDGYAWAGWLNEEEYWPQGSYVFLLEDGEVVEIKYIVSGKVVICGTSSVAEVFVDATFEDGTKSTYYYKGKLRFEDFDATGGGGTGDDGEYNFDYEPIATGEYEVTFDVCQVLNNGNIYNTGSDNVELYLNGLEWMAYFDLFAPLNSGADVYGTYNIVSGQYDEWCGVPSSGGTEEGDTPSFFGTDFTGDGYYMTAYYVVSGTVVIAEDGVTIDATTYYGSKIKASYAGDVNVMTEDTQVARPMQSVATQQGRRKLVKASAEDMVYFGALKNRVRR